MNLKKHHSKIFISLFIMVPFCFTPAVSMAFNPDHYRSSIENEMYHRWFPSSTSKSTSSGNSYTRPYSNKAPIAPSSQPLPHKSSIKELQETFRLIVLLRSQQTQKDWKQDVLNDPDSCWIYEDDPDAAKILYRESTFNTKEMAATLSFSTEPWYQDNPYCVAAISGFSQFNDNTFVWAPPTMEEHIRAFFKLKCSDAALQRLCEAQFITNYNVLHYKVFCSRLMKIQGQAKGKDATALITTYAKELEAKEPKVFQEREAWRGEPFDVSMNDKRIQNVQKKFTDLKFSFDPQILKNAMLARFERTNTTGQNATLSTCFGSIRNHNGLLEDNGMKADTNKSLLKYTQWLKKTKITIPSTNIIWKNS